MNNEIMKKLSNKTKLEIPERETKLEPCSLMYTGQQPCAFVF